MAPDPVGPVDSKTGKINDKILTEPQRLNAYAYGLNGPGRYVDKAGDWAWLIVPAAIYLVLHYSDVANTPTSPTDQTHASNGAGDIAGDGAALVGTIQAVEGVQNTNPFKGPVESERFIVDPQGNTIQVPKEYSLTGSPDGKWLQQRNAHGEPTGTRLDGPHNPTSHPDPRAQVPHAHVPGVTNPDGTPWLPLE